jgi:hypothetical protein
MCGAAFSGMGFGSPSACLMAAEARREIAWIDLLQ